MATGYKRLRSFTFRKFSSYVGLKIECATGTLAHRFLKKDTDVIFYAQVIYDIAMDVSYIVCSILLEQINVMMFCVYLMVCNLYDCVAYVFLIQPHGFQNSTNMI